MLKNKRSIFEEGLNTAITQGSVFLNAYSASYIESVNYGLIVTARCDISQKKVKIHSYLPVISMKDWLSNDFLEILEKRLYSQLENSVVAQFEAVGGTRLLLKTYNSEKIKEKFIDSPPKGKQKKFLDSLEKFELISSAEDYKGSSEAPRLFLSHFENESLRILKELAAQNISGYYFLDDVFGDGPHVVLLREIHHLDEGDAFNLRYGCRIKDRKINYFDDDDCSYTIGLIKSPYIEHIMQKFSELFSRIGVEDPEPDAAKTILRGFVSD